MSGQIDPDEKASVDRHLADCPYCRQDLADSQSWLAQNPPPKTGWRKFIPWLK